MKHWHNTCLLTAAAVLTLTATISSPVAAAFAVTAPQPQREDFVDVAKKAIPAVVSIKTRGVDKENAWDSDHDSDGNGALDGLGDSFLHRFFGNPRGKNSAPQQRSPSEGQASGVIIEASGLVVTNNHVVEDADEIVVILNEGREFKAKLLGRDPNTDLALLRIEGKELPFLPLADSDKLEVGQRVAAIGNPLGLQATMTSGIVSAKGRNNVELAPHADFIQTDASINRGNSGGPLVNLSGEIVGINNAIATTNGGSIGIGFAIPSNIVRHVVDQLLRDGKVTRGYLGVNMQPIDHDLAHALGLNRPEGALIAEVMKGSPADKAGIQRGDIILKHDGNTILNIATLRNFISFLVPGTKLILTVQRDGREITLPVEIGTFPTNFVSNVQSSERFGFTVKSLTPELARKYGHNEDQGVIISEITKGSMAAWSGLKVGALLLEINRQPIETLEEYQQAITKLEKGQQVLLLIKQGGAIRFLTMKVG